MAIGPQIQSFPNCLMQMKLRLHSLSAALGLSLVCSGCATRVNTNKPMTGWFQEPVVELTNYACVQLRPNQNSNVVVVAAISGGGHRAANFAAGVLKALESVRISGTNFNMLREIDYFSTVSGGGFAAGAYVSALHDHLSSGGSADTFSFSDVLEGKSNLVHTNLKRNLELGYHNRLMRGLYSISSIFNLDRGDFLEARLDQKILGQESRRSGESLKLRDVFVPKCEEHSRVPDLPYWFPNATVYENGAIFPFAPDILKKYGITNYTHALKKRSLADPYDLPLAVGMKASASFPVAIPATTLRSWVDGESNPFVHLFDGGLSDNLGIVTGMRTLAADPCTNKLLLVIDTYPGTTEPFSKQSGSPGIPTVLLRSTSISLDSAHSRRDDMVNRLAMSMGAKVVYFSFEVLLSTSESGEKNYIEARKIKTSLNISHEVQAQLLSFGNAAVAQQQKTLESTVSDLFAE
jgi:hypothetical protein